MGVINMEDRGEGPLFTDFMVGKTVSMDLKIPGVKYTGHCIFYIAETILLKRCQFVWLTQ
jgi:hypothetical protein